RRSESGMSAPKCKCRIARMPVDERSYIVQCALCKAAPEYKTKAEQLEIRLREHEKAVGQFLTDMYSIMVDPCAEGTTSVKEICHLLLDGAKEARKLIYDWENKLAIAKGEGRQ